MKKILGLFILMFVLVGCGKEEIPLYDYVSYEITGVNGQGRISSVKVDDEKLVEDYPDLKDNWKTIEYNVIEEDEDLDGNLENDDEIRIEIVYEENDQTDKFEIDNIALLTVSDLPDIIPVNTKFEFDGFQITIKDNYSMTKVDNMFSEYDQKKVVKVPIKIKNLKDERDSLNMFFYEVYGPKEDTKLNTVSAYFMEDKKELDFGSKILPGKTVTRNAYFLYEGKGDYVFYFNNNSEEIQAFITIK